MPGHNRRGPLSACMGHCLPQIPGDTSSAGSDLLRQANTAEHSTDLSVSRGLTCHCRVHINSKRQCWLPRRPPNPLLDGLAAMGLPDRGICSVLAWALAGHGGPHPPGEAPGALCSQQVADALPAVAVAVQDAKAPQLHAALQSRQGAVPLRGAACYNVTAGCRGPLLQ